MYCDIVAMLSLDQKITVNPSQESIHYVKSIWYLCLPGWCLEGRVRKSGYSRSRKMQLSSREWSSRHCGVERSKSSHRETTDWNARNCLSCRNNKLCACHWSELLLHHRLLLLLVINESLVLWSWRVQSTLINIRIAHRICHKVLSGLKVGEFGDSRRGTSARQKVITVARVVFSSHQSSVESFIRICFER